MAIKNDEYIEFEDFNEENEDDVKGYNYKSFSDVVVWGTDWTVETIISQVDKGNIDLNPKFQRRDAWSSQEKSRLIESLMLGIPVPPIILAEKESARGQYIVIDGKQRLLTLCQFKSNKIEGFENLKLNNLNILDELNGYTADEIENIYNLKNFIDQLENQTLRTVVIKNWPNEEFLFTVFLRLNTGSKKLSPQELRQALHPGPFLDFLDDATDKSENFHILLSNKKADARMRDIELALRYYAFKYNFKNNTGNLKEFLDSTCKKLNSEWNKSSEHFEKDFLELEEAIKFMFNTFGEKAAFSRYTENRYSNRFNRPLFEVFTFYFSKPRIREEVENRKGDFLKGFEHLSMTDEQFNESIASTTKELSKVEYRFNKIAQLIEKYISFEVVKVSKKGSRLDIKEVLK